MTQTQDILEKLVGFDTVSSKSNLDLVDYVEDFLKTCGFAIQRISDDTGQKAGLYAELGPAGDGVLLSGHTDVVPVEGQTWTRDPFRLTRQDGKLYGRGTTDMKGYVASVLALANRAAHTELKEPLKIALSYDEEVGCVGIQHMLDQLAPMLGRPWACFVGEPTEMQVATGHKGKAALRAIFHGQNGHSALAPHFVNALNMAVDFAVELRNLQAHFEEHGARDPAYRVPCSTIHIGKMSGGVALNIVPDRAEMLFEYRHLPEDRADALLDRITAAAHRVEKTYAAEAKIEIDQYNAYPGLDVADTAPVVPMAQRLSRTNTTTKVAFGTEAGFFDALGIPTVVCGPGSMEGQGHKADEYVSLDQLAACDAMMDRILSELSVS